MRLMFIWFFVFLGLALPPEFSQAVGRDIGFSREELLSVREPRESHSPENPRTAAFRRRSMGAEYTREGIIQIPTPFWNLKNEFTEEKYRLKMNFNPSNFFGVVDVELELVDQNRHYQFSMGPLSASLGRDSVTEVRNSTYNFTAARTGLVWGAMNDEPDRPNLFLTFGDRVFDSGHFISLNEEALQVALNSKNEVLLLFAKYNSQERFRWRESQKYSAFNFSTVSFEVVSENKIYKGDHRSFMTSYGCQRPLVGEM